VSSSTETETGKVEDAFLPVHLSADPEFERRESKVSWQSPWMSHAPGHGEQPARAPRRDRSGSTGTQAELASRTKDEFLAILGHELRNPLAPMMTALTPVADEGVACPSWRSWRGGSRHADSGWSTT
jgi:signal transduction histidine kinase